MKSTAKSKSSPQRLPVQWLDSPAVGPLMIFPSSGLTARQEPRPTEIPAVQPDCLGRARLQPSRTYAKRVGQDRSRMAFTLLELMMVIAIIGFVAGMTLSHIGNFGHANSMSAAARQIQDDAALARQLAMTKRSTVYMVFLPPEFWTNAAYANVQFNPQETNLMMHQYAAYALVSLSSVGDQPGKHTPRYLTDWRYLPDGVFFAPFEFGLSNNAYYNITTTNTLSGTTNQNVVYGWSSVTGVPFPSLYPPNTLTMTLPCIAFTPQGSLTTPYTNQYIALARGSIFYPTDTNGVPLFGPANLAESPANNDVNNPNLLQIDWLTGRATLVQNQFQ